MSDLSSRSVTTVDSKDDSCPEECPCMFRLVEVAGELYVPSESPRTAASRLGARATTPTPRALPYTGLHMAVGQQPSTVIISDLLSHMLPADLDAPVMLLGSTGDYASFASGDYPTITLSDADVEEVRDLDPQDSHQLDSQQPAPVYDTAAGTPAALG